MKKMLFTMVLGVTCGLAIGQSGEYFSATQTRKTSYLEAIDVQKDSVAGVVTTTLVPGEVITGIRVVRAFDGSCLEERKVLLRLENVETANGTVQRAIVETNLKPVACIQ